MLFFVCAFFFFMVLCFMRCCLGRGGSGGFGGGLFFLGQWNYKVFEFAHLYMWQALIMLDVLVVWLLWMRFVAKREAPPAATAPAA